MFGESGQQAWKWSILARHLVHKTTVGFDHSLCKLAPKLCYLVSSITLDCRTVWSVYISLTQKQQPTSLESSQENQAGLLTPALYCSSVWERVLGQGLAGQSVSLQARSLWYRITVPPVTDLISLGKLLPRTLWVYWVWLGYS